MQNPFSAGFLTDLWLMTSAEQSTGYLLLYPGGQEKRIAERRCHRGTVVQGIPASIRPVPDVQTDEGCCIRRLLRMALRIDCSCTQNRSGSRSRTVHARRFVHVEVFRGKMQ